MLFNINKSRVGKILLLILVLLSLSFVGCVRAPCRGWSGPIVSDNILYVGSIKGKVLALDISEGKPREEPLWKKELEGKAGGGFGCATQISTPMSTYGVPAIAIGENKVYVGGYDGNVYSFTLDDGDMNKFPTGGAIVGSPVIAGDTLFVGSSDGKLYALNLNLSPKWAEPFKTGDKIWSTPAVDNGVVYIGSSDHKLYAIDTESGQEIWHFEAEAGILSTPLVFEGMVYIGACDNKFYAIKVNQEEKEAKAEWVFNEAESWFWTQALAYNGKIYVGNLDHKVYAINAQNPEDFRVVCETQGRVRTPPVLVDGLIIVGSEDGNVYAYDPEKQNGGVRCSLGAPILAPLYPDPENGVVYVHAQDGTHTLYAIKVETGKQLWSYKTSG